MKIRRGQGRKEDISKGQGQGRKEDIPRQSQGQGQGRKEDTPRPDSPISPLMMDSEFVDSFQFQKNRMDMLSTFLSIYIV